MNKYRLMYLSSIALWFLCVIGLFLYSPNYDAEAEVEPTPTTEEQTVQKAKAEPMRKAPIFVVVDFVDTVEFDPVRDDIPLDAETQRLLYKACCETGIQYELALAVVWQETNFRNITGDGGDSAGYMQVQQKWHQARMDRLGVADLNDPYGNFLVGCDYLAELIERYGSVEQALVAYNQGKFKGTVTEYAKSVLKYKNILTMEEN